MYIVDIYIFQYKIYSNVFKVVTKHKNHLGVILHLDGKLSDVPMGCMYADVQK